MELLMSNMKYGHHLLLKLNTGIGRHAFNNVTSSTSIHPLYSVTRVRHLNRSYCNVRNEGSKTHFLEETFVRATTHHQMLREYLNVSSKVVTRMLKNDDRLRNCHIDDLTWNINTLIRYGIEGEDVMRNRPLLYRTPLCTEQYFGLLKEMEVKNLSAYHCNIFLQLYKKDISTLRRDNILTSKRDPRDSLLEKLNLPPKHVANLTPSSKLDDMTFKVVHNEIKHEVLSWRLGCTPEFIKQKEAQNRLNRKSLTIQQYILDMWYSEFGVSAEYLLRNVYLLSCSPYNMERIKRMKTICGIDIKDFVNNSPKIYLKPAHDLIRIDNILCNLDVSKEVIFAVPRILGLKPETIEQRIRHLKQIPQLEPLMQLHPRKLFLIYNYKNVLDNLHKLEKKDIDVPVVNTLNTMILNKSLEQNERGDLNQQYVIKDIITCLSQYFDMEKSEIRKAIRVKTNFEDVSIVKVQTNLSYLKEAGFTNDDILSALDIVLYSPNQVKDHLDKLPHRPETQPYLQMKPHIAIKCLLYFIYKDQQLVLKSKL